jgi:hypothetical protein
MTHQHTDITSIQIEHMKQDMQIGTLNVGGLGPSYNKTSDLRYQFAAYRLDTLPNTRQVDKDVKVINRIIKDLLPVGTYD